MSQAGNRPTANRLSLPVDNQRKYSNCACSAHGAGQCADALTCDAAVEDLLLWRDPARTGIIFGVVTVAYLLLEWSNYSLLSLIANGLLGLVCVAFLWSNGAQFLNK